MAETGEIPESHEFSADGPAPGLVEPPVRPRTPAAVEVGQDKMDVDGAVDVNAPKKPDLKGKGKAVDMGSGLGLGREKGGKGKQRAAGDAMDVEVAHMMNDITKGISFCFSALEHRLTRFLFFQTFSPS